MAAIEWSMAEAARSGRALIHTAREAALGTLGASGTPHVSHVACVPLPDGSPAIFVSDLALHTKFMRADPRASLLFVAPPEADTNARGRITLEGTLAPVADRGLARARFLRRHPDAAMYVDFTDFHFMRLAPSSAYLVAGFGRITALDPKLLLSPAASAAALAEIDDGACDHMDEDHADALALMATKLAGGAPGDWRAAGVDPRGIDLFDGTRVVRAEFDAPLEAAGPLRVALKRLTDAARSKGPEGDSEGEADGANRDA
ncbi:MAG: pyridoxamine 5'-phosphate oxidase family protein [Pseudomonadota bacterium]